MSPPVSSPYSLIGSIEVFEPALHCLIDPVSPIGCVADGFAWTEGPAWDPKRQHLYFSDIPNNRIHTWDVKDGLKTAYAPAGRQERNIDEYASPGTNGLWMTEDDKLLICNQDARTVDIIDLQTDAREAVASSFNSLPFNSPNDVICSSEGLIYFTDPPFGLKNQKTYQGRELDFCGVYRVSLSGVVSAEIKDMSFPNGLAFSHDESVFYVSQSDRAFPVIKRFEVGPQGYIGQGEVFYNCIEFCDAGDPGLPDGMTVDVHGNLFATIAGGVAILSPDGTLLGRIATGKSTSNCTFGEDGSTLFITAHDSLLRVQTKTKGLNF